MYRWGKQNEINLENVYVVKVKSWKTYKLDYSTIALEFITTKLLQTLFQCIPTNRKAYGHPTYFRTRA